MRQTKPIVWFLLSGIWCVAGLVDVLDHYAPLSVGFKFLAALACCGLGIGQFCFDKQGARGKKRMNLLCVGVFVLLIAYLIVVLILT